MGCEGGKLVIPEKYVPVFLLRNCSAVKFETVRFF